MSTTFQPRTRKVPLYQGDYQQRIEEAAAAVMRADLAIEKAIKDDKVAPPRLGSDESGEVVARREREALAEAHDALVSEAEEVGVVWVTLAAQRRKKYHSMVLEHPPRDGNDDDKNLGVNDETFGEALVPESVIEIQGTDLTRDELLDAISSAQFDLLYGISFALNRDPGRSPKDRLSSRNQSSVAISG